MSMDNDLFADAAVDAEPQHAESRAAKNPQLHGP